MNKVSYKTYDEGGIVKGKSHADGGEHFIVNGSGQHVELEGREAVISAKAFEDTKTYKYKGTNWDILNQINKKYGGNSLYEKVESIGVGDFVICISSVEDDTVREITGTNEQVISSINESGGCISVTKGAKVKEILDNRKAKKFKEGGAIERKRNETYKKWRHLVNMSASELERFRDSEEGQKAGLTASQARAQGIGSGRESARWIIKMKRTPKSEWTDEMWRWAGRQVSFISRMSGNEGPLYDEKGRKTRKHLSLLIWGHNPKRKDAGGGLEDLSESSKGGDCYMVAGLFAMNEVFAMNDIEFVGMPYVVHAEVQGQGAISHLRYGHAWVEDDIFVYDYSNNREIIFPKVLYYRIGQVNTEDATKYRRYTFDEARRKMLETGIYGPWDVETEYKKGGRTVAQTPAPKKDRIKGSAVNKPKSASSSKSAVSIELSPKTVNSIKTIIDKHNQKYPSKKITLGVAKAVVRRGMGAYSASHRPTISGGKPNSRVAWGLARLNAFVFKAQKGFSKSRKYSQDNDLLDELGIRHKKFEKGGDVIKGGKADGMSIVDIFKHHKLKPSQLKSFFAEYHKGIKHELEHTSDRKVAEEIAKDHIYERVDYYTMLEKLEK